MNAPEWFAFWRAANVTQAFGHDAAGFAENCPAINGWASFKDIKQRARRGDLYQLLRDVLVGDFLHGQGDDDFVVALEEVKGSVVRHGIEM